MDKAEIFQKVKELTERLPAAGNVPSPYWSIFTNYQPNTTWIVFPGTGTLWISYEYRNAPAQSIEVVQSGGTTPINVGQNYIPVKAGAFISYTLGNPGKDQIDLAYAIT
jgi:hypothetical protein